MNKKNKGSDTNALTMFATLFHNYSKVLYWRVDFIVVNQVGSGMSSLILKKNQLPINGYCLVSPTNGISLLTLFSVTCVNWEDLNGQITTYEFMGMSLTIHLDLNFTNGNGYS